MSERSTYLYALTRIPTFYGNFQNLLGAQNARMRIVEELLLPKAGMKVLDVGCGPAPLRPYLGNVQYTGVDLNADHIEKAKRNAQPTDSYLVGDVVTDLDFEPNSFDLIMLIGVLHHIDDAGARKLFQRMAQLISKSGRIVTVDGVFLPNQRTIARIMLKRDAGKHVRIEKGYSQLVEGLPLKLETKHFNNLLRLPYDHLAMTCTQTSN
jgi:SAM-dependent methyltransferase